ncbi:MAG: Txe/YoeB family addiction module toxin [Saprospiraceae bacterium]
MKYSIQLSSGFEKDISKLKAENIKLLAKVWELIFDIDKHPFAGKGKPEALKGNLSGWWSRRINQKHRLIYRIDETLKEIELISCYGHYGDK